MSKLEEEHNDTLLGKQVDYVDQYAPQLLFAIDRQLSRDSLNISAAQLPFKGGDIWNAYELSWLNSRGKPLVAWAEFYFPCDSRAIVESKSFKLYLNSLNQTVFDSVLSLQKVLVEDLSSCVGAKVDVLIHSLEKVNEDIGILEGRCIDSLDVSIDSYSLDPSLLKADSNTVTSAILTSDLLRSLCPVTGQPDWGSLQISYTGPEIEPESLLKYLVGYRQHQEFHEQCVERIFSDIMQYCRPRQLSVYARYVRRGGLDINPFRSTDQFKPPNTRLVRQ